MPRHRSEQVKASDKAYRDAHKEEAKARSRAWVKANPEKRRATEKAYRDTNREKIAATKKLWNQRNGAARRAANKRWKMNRRLTLPDFEAMLAAQGGVCAVCGLPGNGRTGSGRLAIDHCHETDAVRGLLCHRCNSMLGLAKDNVETLRRAIAYLEAACERHQGRGALRGDERGLLRTP